MEEPDCQDGMEEPDCQDGMKSADLLGRLPILLLPSHSCTQKEVMVEPSTDRTWGRESGQKL